MPSNIFYFTVSSQHHKMQENREGKSNSTAGDFEEKPFELVAGVENENKQDSTVAMKKLWALIGRNPSTDRIESALATNPPQSAFETSHIPSPLEVVLQVISNNDDAKVLEFACRALSHLTYNSREDIKFVINHVGWKRLVDLLSENTSPEELTLEVIHAVGVTVTYLDDHDDLKGQLTHTNNIFRHLSELLSSSTSSNTITSRVSKCR